MLAPFRAFRGFRMLLAMAMWMLARADLRRRRSTLAALVMLTALVVGLALAAVAGGRRTGSALERFFEDAGGSDVTAGVPASEVVLAAAALGHVVATSVTRRRRDLAVLRSLGFTGHQLGATVVWQASSFVVAALVVAVPVGVLLDDSRGTAFRSAYPCFPRR